MIIILGLGNIGQKYEGHRHNVGFQILDALAAREGLSFAEKDIFHASITQFGQLVLVKPTTFMNNSGQAAKALLKQYPEATLVVLYDDIDIHLGDIKCSFGRGAGGHNGIQSVIDHVGHKDFLRIRVGVRPVHEELLAKIAPPDGFETFLLSNFAPFETEKRDEGINKAINAIELLPHKTKAEIMNLCN